ncbi:hypothetical protein BC835DRAFT_1307736 [Cytidiella melzeri]|nr:hypothetical protein BC835DRAFT_1307736 [Cytidiella melzeri]
MGKRPLACQLPNVLDALMHMLLRGEDLASAQQIAAELDALNAEMSAIKLDNAAQSQILPELPQPALPRSPAPSRQSTSTVSTPLHPARKHEAFGRPSSGLYPRLNSLRESSTHAARHPSTPSSSSNKSARTATPLLAAVVVVDSDSENDRWRLPLELALRKRKQKVRQQSAQAPGTRKAQAVPVERLQFCGVVPLLWTRTPLAHSSQRSDVCGHIISSLVKPPPIVHYRVPSLGNALDKYVDWHGLPNEFILNSPRSPKFPPCSTPSLTGSYYGRCGLQGGATLSQQQPKVIQDKVACTMAPPHEKKSTQKSLTPAEKQARSQQRKEKNFCMNQKLDNALSEVWKLAEALHKDLGTNSVKYCSSPGAPRPKVHDFAPQICNLWKAMSKQEQVAATEEELVQIAGVKEMKKTASHSVALNAFHDARALLASVQSQMESLHNRTGLEMLLLAVRADAQNVSCPQVWTSGDVVDEFFQLTNKMLLSDYAVSGIQGTAKTYESELRASSSPKSCDANKVIASADEAVAPCSVSKMFYTNFDMHITEKYGIVVVNWPLPQFVAPGSIDSRLELQTLYNAWLSGSTHFRCLSRRFSTQVAAALATSPPVDQGTRTTLPLARPQMHPHCCLTRPHYACKLVYYLCTRNLAGDLRPACNVDRNAADWHLHGQRRPSRHPKAQEAAFRQGQEKRPKDEGTNAD